MEIKFYNKEYTLVCTLTEVGDLEYHDKVNDVGSWSFTCVNSASYRGYFRYKDKSPLIMYINSDMQGIVAGYEVDVSTNIMRVSGYTMNVLLDWHTAQYINLIGSDGQNARQTYDLTAQHCGLSAGVFDVTYDPSAAILKNRNVTCLSDNQAAAREWDFRFWVEFDPVAGETKLNYKSLGTISDFIATSDNTSEVYYSDYIGSQYDTYDVYFSNGIAWGVPLEGSGNPIIVSGYSKQYIGTFDYEPYTRYMSFDPKTDVPSRTAEQGNFRGVDQKAFPYYNLSLDDAPIEKSVIDQFNSLNGKREGSYSAVFLSDMPIGKRVRIFDTRVSSILKDKPGYVGEFIIGEKITVYVGTTPNYVYTLVTSLPGDNITGRTKVYPREYLKELFYLEAAEELAKQTAEILESNEIVSRNRAAREEAAEELARMNALEEEARIMDMRAKEQATKKSSKKK